MNPKSHDLILVSDSEVTCLVYIRIERDKAIVDTIVFM